MSLHLNLRASYLHSIRLHSNNLVTHFGFSHLYHLLLGQVASSCQRSCLKVGAMATNKGARCALLILEPLKSLVKCYESDKIRCKQGQS
jgi:hypothetical protein